MNATEDLSAETTKSLLRKVDQITETMHQLYKSQSDPSQRDELLRSLRRVQEELSKRGGGPPNNTPPGLRPKEMRTVIPSEFLPPQNAAAPDAFPDGLAFGVTQEEWRLGISAQVTSNASGSLVDMVLALENQHDCDRYYMTEGSTHPLDIFIVSESGASATLGMEMKIHFQMWQRFSGRMISGRSAEIFHLQYGPEYFKGFSGDCLLYARAHIPAGTNQRSAEILSDSVGIKLPGNSTVPAGTVRFVSPATTRAEHNKRDVQSAPGVSSTHPAPRATGELQRSMISRSGAWLFAGLALFAVAASILLRAILRTRSNSSASHR